MCLNPIYLEKLQNFVPCRKCVECKMARAREWAVRLYSELKTAEKSCFITLTYSDENNPHILVKEDFQKFMKRLRKDFHVKYFACGEYGDKFLRPHFHAILYGVNFSDDKIMIGKSKKGFPMCISDTLGKYWKFGNHTIEDCSLSTMIYTSLYAQKDKKILPDNFTPEFNLFSKSLGMDHLLVNMDTYLKTDEVWIDGKAYKIPEAVLKKCFVTYNSSGCIESKEQTLIDLKDKRSSLQQLRYPKQAKVIEDIKTYLWNCDNGFVAYADISAREPYLEMKRDQQERSEKIQKIKSLIYKQF